MGCFSIVNGSNRFKFLFIYFLFPVYHIMAMLAQDFFNEKNKHFLQLDSYSF